MWRWKDRERHAHVSCYCLSVCSNGLPALWETKSFFLLLVINTLTAGDVISRTLLAGLSGLSSVGLVSDSLIGLEASGQTQ